MSQILKIDSIEDLPDAPASDVKKLGWRGVMKSVGSMGKLVVTNHGEPEAVILSVAEYGVIVRALKVAETKNDSVLDALRRNFDERLASLELSNAGDRLRSVMREPVKLGGKVKVGTGY